MNSDSSARAIFCAKKNTGNLFTGDSEIPVLDNTQSISFTQASFESRAQQLIEAIQLNKEAYKKNIVILANVRLSLNFPYSLLSICGIP